jgi:hypothetical protein
MLKINGVVLTAVLFGAAVLPATTTITPVSAISWQEADPQGGELNCIGGKPTGTQPPCSPGSKTQLRGIKLTYRQVAATPEGNVEVLHTGARTVVLNANYDENGRGTIWGTWHLVLDSGIGEWDGVFTGFVYGWLGLAEGEILGYGTAGQVEGLSLRAIFTQEALDPTSGKPAVQVVTGSRVDPGVSK